jgi:hypothetical protein
MMATEMDLDKQICSCREVMIGFKHKIVTLLAGSLVVRKFREAALVAVSNDRWPAVWLVCREASVELGWAAGGFWGWAGGKTD